ncbi:MAG: UvrD-helicase domain-containing protein [Pseudomonadota bacterium]
MIVDQLAREKAVNPQRSFTVTAPAGSGKTELLTQRYLSLLAVVDQPESILAITFTRKAVAEMRERIMAALEQAKAFQEDSMKFAEHRLKTIELAQAALQADHHRQWGLLENPARMRIYTFDAFSASLVRQMPISSRFGGNASPGEHPEQFYQQAIERVLAHLGSDTEHSAAIEKLLLHMNVRVQHVANLLMQLLAKRDQWRGVFASMRGDADRAVEVLHQWFCEQVEFSLSNARALLLPHERQLCGLMNFASAQLRELGTPGLLPDNQQAITEIPGASIEELASWRAVGRFLLTRQGGFRATVNIKQGFPPKKSKPQYTVDDFKNLVLAIRDHKDATAVVSELHILPDPDEIKRHQAILHSLMAVLHLSMAYLEIEFQKRQQVDFVATSLQALEALADNSDLAMKLEYSIQHILVDEFQDTSQLQYDLLDRLCQEWSDVDVPGRSLFLVGDAMQSIYAFRNARVALFMHARQYGLAGVTCENLELQSNFRSDPPIIDWLNHCFARVFPEVDDLRQNASAYVTAACASSSSGSNSEVLAYEFALNPDSQREAEAQHIARKIGDLYNLYPDESIAILVRNRSHAHYLLPTLRANGIDVAFTDFERLLDQSIVADLLSLTRMLLNPADQIAWYAFLRSPLMNITLADLLTVSQNNSYNVRQGIAMALQEDDVLSDTAGERLRLFLSAYDAVFEQRHRKSLTTQLAGLWLHLGGELVYADEPSHLAYQNYMSELLSLCSAEVQLTWETIEQHIAQLRVKSRTPSHSNTKSKPIELMTMHKAKGLEFDSVIIPALDLGIQSEGAELLAWTEQFVTPSRSTLLLGLPDGHKSPVPTAYDYVRKQNRRQSTNEAARLLYVACSRARKRLYVYRAFDPDRPEHHASNSLAALLWPHLPETANTVHDYSLTTAEEINSVNVSYSRRKRHPAELTSLRDLHAIDSAAVTGIEHQFSRAINTADWLFSRTDEYTLERCIGVVVHRNLQQWANEGGHLFWQKSDAERKTVLSTQLRANGLRDKHAIAINWVEKALLAAREDQQHQWLFEGGNTEAEFRIALGDDVRSIVIDRLLDDVDGNKWIVDYKVHLNEFANNEDLAKLAQTHLSQLQTYQQAFAVPTRIAVYYVLQQTLIELT